MKYMQVQLVLGFLLFIMMLSLWEVEFTKLEVRTGKLLPEILIRIEAEG